MTQRIQRLRNSRGFTSILAVAFILSVVFFALTQTLSIVSRSGPDVDQQDRSIRAFYIAESAQQYVNSRLKERALNTDIRVGTLCTQLTTDDPNSAYNNPFLQRGVAVTVTSPVADEQNCSVQVRACLVTGLADPNCTTSAFAGFFSRRASVSGSSFVKEGGYASFSETYTLSLKNGYDTDGVVLFNTAFKRRTTGAALSGTCVACSGEFWYSETGTTIDSIANLGYYKTLVANATGSITVDLTSDKNPGQVAPRSGVITGIVFPSRAGVANAVVGSTSTTTAGAKILCADGSGCLNNTFSVTNGFYRAVTGGSTALWDSQSQGTTTGLLSFSKPAGVTAITVTLVGAGGKGGDRTNDGCAGGGGGGAVAVSAFSLPSAASTIYVFAPASNANDAWIRVDGSSTTPTLAELQAGTVVGALADSGSSGPNDAITAGSGGLASASFGVVTHAGGSGATGTVGGGASCTSGGGGSSAGESTGGNTATSETGATAISLIAETITGTAISGGAGGSGGANQNTNGAVGEQPGGGGGGARRRAGGTRTGGSGGVGRVIIEYETPGSPVANTNWCEASGQPTIGADLMVFMLGASMNGTAVPPGNEFTQEVIVDPGGRSIRLGEWPNAWKSAANRSVDVCSVGGSTSGCRTPFQYLAHYPRIGLNTPGVDGTAFVEEVASEVFYFYNPYLYGVIEASPAPVLASGVLSVTLPCVGCTQAQVDKWQGTFVKVLDSVVSLPPRARITAATVSGGTVTLQIEGFDADGVRCTTNCDAAFPSTAQLSGKTICGGVCALLNGTTAATATSIQVLRTAYNKSQWAGGLICARAGEVDPLGELKFVIGTVQRTGGTWSEVVSD